MLCVDQQYNQTSIVARINPSSNPNARTPINETEAVTKSSVVMSVFDDIVEINVFHTAWMTMAPSVASGVRIKRRRQCHSSDQYRGSCNERYHLRFVRRMSQRLMCVTCCRRRQRRR